MVTEAMVPPGHVRRRGRGCVAPRRGDHGVADDGVVVEGSEQHTVGSTRRSDVLAVRWDEGRRRCPGAWQRTTASRSRARPRPTRRGRGSGAAVASARRHGVGGRRGLGCRWWRCSRPGAGARRARGGARRRAPRRGCGRRPALRLGGAPLHGRVPGLGAASRGRGSAKARRRGLRQRPR